MLRLLLVIALLSVPAYGRGQAAEKPDGKAQAPVVVVSRSGPLRFGSLWVGGGGTFTTGQRLFPLYRPWHWYDPWYDLLSPAGVFENCYAYPGPCRFYQAPPGDQAGVISLETDRAEASVYIDGGYAGQARDLEKMRLPAGVYVLRIEEAGFEPFEQKIYLLSGKKVKIRPALTRQEVNP